MDGKLLPGCVSKRHGHRLKSTFYNNIMVLFYDITITRALIQNASSEKMSQRPEPDQAPAAASAERCAEQMRKCKGPREAMGFTHSTRPVAH